MRNKKFTLVFSVMVFVYAFLYIPIFYTLFFSFNASSSLSQWSGFSLDWYRSLLQNRAIWDALFVSLRVATASATLAVTIGTLSALLFVRFSTMKGKTFWEFVSTIPLVMPEVITGLAFLVFFVTSENLFGWPMGRGVNTITIAHTTLTLAYVIIVIRSRLMELDRTYEEAALDLGAKPLRVFFLVTLPMLYPSILAGWLLAFTLSMDDLVIASFTSGPNSATLPIFLFSTLKTGPTPEINALSSCIILMVAILVPVIGTLMFFPSKKSKSKP